MSMWNAIVAGRRAAAVLLKLLRRWCRMPEGVSSRQVSADRFGASSAAGPIDARKNRNFKIPLSVAGSGAFFRLSRRGKFRAISAIVRHPNDLYEIPQHFANKRFIVTDQK